MRLIVSLLSAALLSLLCVPAFAAPGDLDTSFNLGTGANNTVYTSAVQADGKTIIGGYFTTVNGVVRNRIARLNADGSLDSSFNTGTGANSYVVSSAVQADGKIIIGGYFTTVNGVARNRIARLNADGSLDSSFNPGTGASDGVLAITLQADGKVIIGGVDNTNDAIWNHITRLNADGSLDSSFNTGTGANDTVSTSTLQSDGKIIIGGKFTFVNVVARNYIARLNADGSLDSGFNPGTGANGDVSASALQADGKIIIGGAFTTVNGVARNYIARLNADGSLDNSFNPGTGANSNVMTIALQSDGKMLIGGWFTAVNGVARERIARLNADGSVDSDFNASTGANGYVFTSVILADGKLFIGGVFTAVNGVARNRIARIHTGDSDADGIQDAADFFPNDTDNDGLTNDIDTDDDGDGTPDVIDLDPLNASLNETDLPLNGNYKGSTIKDSAAPL